MLELYSKINTIFERNDKGIITVGRFATDEIAYLAECNWEFTEKIDGTNIRIGFDGASVKIGGRTNNAQIPTFLYDRLTELFPPEAFDFFERDDELGTCDVTLYGEGYGARIQKGGGNYNPDGVDFILFDVKVGQWWLSRQNVEKVAADLGIDVVPVVDYGPLAKACAIVQDESFVSRWPQVKPEGLVCRPIVSLFDRKGHRIITKIKRKDFERLDREEKR